MKLGYKLIIILVIVWAATFTVFATRENIKSYGEHEATFFAENGYNFEYKLGFPTPWYSKYYILPPDQVDKYKSSSSEFSVPPDDFMIYEDISYDILAIQALLALVAPVSVVALAKGANILRRAK